jgi:hypothetical protein
LNKKTWHGILFIGIPPGNEKNAERVHVNCPLAKGKTKKINSTALLKEEGKKYS